MTITIDIPAISELAAAINNLAASGKVASLIAQLEKRTTPTPEALAALTADALGANEPDTALVSPSAEPTTPPADSAPKRTRRTKAEMEAAKAIEDKLGRRTDTPTPEPIEQVSALVDEANAESTDFQWTFPLLKETFADPISAKDKNDPDQVKAANERIREMKGIIASLDPNVDRLSMLPVEHYAAFAAKATAWYAQQGLELNLPEGAAV